MKDKHIKAHMKAAYVYAELSYCKRRQVGCVIVKNNTPIAVGYNGTPSGEENHCEDENDVTKPNVIHAEDNALRKLVKSHESSDGAIVFVTTAPCIRCAEKLADANIAKLYYSEVYRGEEGLEYLKKHNIEITQLQV